MRVFLDVGANNGQTLVSVLNRDFDKIVCFEPAPPCWPYLEKITDDRVRVQRFGLWNRTITARLYEPGKKGGGMWRKDASPQMIDEAHCEFVRASDWFAQNLSISDVVYMKLNCEGAEYDILEDLMQSGEFAKVSYALVSFHGHKISSMRKREDFMRYRLAEHPHISYAETLSLDAWLGATL